MWGTRKKYDSNQEKDILFQVLDWHCEDVTNDETGFPEFKIFAFGVSSDGHPVNIRFDNFYPYFYIEVPPTWTSECVQVVKKSLQVKNIRSISFVQKKKYYGFENNKIRNFCKLTFYSERAKKYLIKKIETESFSIDSKYIRFQLYESNIDSILRFCHQRDILTAGWLTIPFDNVNSDDCDYFSTDWNNVSSYDSSNKMADFRILYFDIEACSEDGSFPSALKPNDRVTQICCILKDSHSSKSQKYLFNLDSCGSIEDTTVVECASEQLLLMYYAKFIVDTDPDIIVGYNIFGFDNGYLFERAKVLGMESEFNYQSKLASKFTEVRKKVLNNQQSGFNEWKMTRIYGRIHIDLLQVIKKDFKLESYKLNYVGEHFLKEGKDDVTPREIFEAWSEPGGTKEKRTRVGKYCVQDTNLCLLLFEKFAVLQNHIEMAKVTRVPVEYLITRGQSIKVFSQIAYETRKEGFLIPVLPIETKDTTFQGATVLEAKVGYYTKPVAGLDFASLYPSIMIAHNMCYSTVILDPLYGDLPECEYSHIEWVDSEGKQFRFSFVQNQKGVLSGILDTLWKNRKITKKEMNKATDPFVKTILNAKQLAIKVSMNSIYGFTGATVGALPCLEISQSVTGCGRQMIEQTSRIAKEQFCCEIVYGDSVTSDTPILIKKDSSVTTVYISNLFNIEDKAPYGMDMSKEQSIPPNIEVWTSNGWKRIMRVIRHKCNKNIYRVHTNTGVVEVTEDHSLLDEKKESIKPDDIYPEDVLYHHYPTHKTNYNNRELNQIFINIGSVPIDKMIYFSQGYLNNQRVSTAILNESAENQKWFFYGICYSMLSFSKKTCLTIKSSNKLLLSRYYLLGRNIGLYCKILHIEYSSEYTLHFYENEIKDFNKVVHITKLPKITQYVYDIETEDSTFQAGIGQMIIHNTDSCYVIFPDSVDSDGTLTTLFKKAEEAAHAISKTFKKPIELEFEKFMYPLILVAKKRYMYVEWTDPHKHNGEIEAKGVELVRRDNCPYVKETLDAVLQPIMFENNITKGRSEAENHIDSLLNGKVDIKKLILSKTLKNDYKNPDTIAHYQLVEKMKLRDPNSAPKPGDRVPFVYINIGDPKALTWKKVEDPEYVVENNIPIDTLYYLEHQLKNPLKTIFDILLGDSSVLFQRKSMEDAKKREKISIGEAKRKKEGNQDIRNFFKLSINI